MTASAANIKLQRKRERVRQVEALMLDNLCAREIHDRIGEKFDVTYGTIRNDCSGIYKMWEGDSTSREQFEGKARFLASLRQLRKLSIRGSRITRKPDGTVITSGMNYELAHKLDKEIARFSGVRLASDETRLHLDVGAARDYMETVMQVVFKHVPEAERQEAIMRDIAALAGVDPSAADLGD